MIKNEDVREIPKGEIVNESTGERFVAKKEIGRGGFSLVFTATKVNADGVEIPGETFLFKELFPMGWSRGENDSVAISRNKKEKYKKLIEMFRAEYSNGQAVSEKLWESAPSNGIFIAQNGNAYLKLKYLKHGMSLSDFVEEVNRRELSVDLRSWVVLFGKLAGTIGDLHNISQIIHGDISPKNIMLMHSDDFEETFKAVTSGEFSVYAPFLLDFGCSFQASAPEGNGICYADKREEIYTTNGYSCPDLWDPKQKRVSSRCDIYSLVACFEYCVTGKLRYNDGKLDEKEPEIGEELPSTVKSQLLKIFNNGRSRLSNRANLINTASELTAMLQELLDRIDNNGVSKATIWEAMRRDYEKKLKGRFSGIGPADIKKEIFPLGEAFDITASTADGEAKKVLDLIREHSSEHILLIGDGGIGKTTALVSMLHDVYSREKEYNENNAVPIYVELNNAPERIDALITPGDGGEKGGTSTFILRYIASLISGQNYSEISPDMLQNIRDELNVENKKNKAAEPEYILLLDGLNEVSQKWSTEVNASVQGTLILEIRKLLANSPNVRAVITSRADHTGIDSTEEVKLTRVTLSGISDDMVYDYICKCQLKERISAVKSNPSLLECLRVPLFLMMYCGISKDYADITSRGEILRYFWNEVTDKYSQNLISKNISDNRNMSAHMRMFILDFIAPAICDEMERNSEFKIKLDDAEKIIERVLNDRSDIGILGDFGKKCFVKYKRKVDSYRHNIATTAGALNSLTNYVHSAAQRILVELINMGILYDSDDDSYGVRHHFYRDYFAAVHTVNSLQLAVYMNVDGKNDLAFTSLSDFIKTPIKKERATLAGEYLGEHKNVPVQDTNTGNWSYNVPTVSNHLDRNLINQALDIFRGKFDVSIEYGVRNLVQILKLTRRMLAGEDFSSLDLSRCNLNNAYLGVRGLGACLRNAKINSSAIFCMGHSARINAVMFSKDGKKVVTASWDETARIWSTETGELLHLLEGHRGAVRTVTFSSDERILITTSDDNTAKIWSTETGELLHSLEGHTNEVTAATFSPDEKKVVTASVDSTAKIWSAETGELLHSLERHARFGHTDVVNSAVFSPNGKKVVTASWDRTAKIWSVETGELLFSLDEHTREVTIAAFSPDGKKVVTVSGDIFVNIKIWSAETGELLRSLEGHSSECNAIAFSSDGKMFITASEDRTAKIWSAETGELLHSLDGHENAVTKAAFSPDGKKVVTASWDNTVKIWSAETGELLRSLKGQSCDVDAVALNSDGNVFMVVEDSTAKIWSAETGELLHSLDGHENAVATAAFSSDGEKVVTASRDNTAKIWSAETGELLFSLDEHKDAVTKAAFSPDGETVISVSGKGFIIDDRTTDIKIWSAETGAVLSSLEGNIGSVRTVAVSSGGKMFITASDGNTAEIWSAKTGELLHPIRGHSKAVTKAAFSSDGEKIVTASRDNTAKIWSAETGELLYSIDGHSSKTHAVAFSLDGKKVVTASFDGYYSTLKIWLTEMGKLSIPLEEQAGVVLWTAAFSPDGKKVVTASSNGTNNAVKIWSAEAGELLFSLEGPEDLVCAITLNSDGAKAIIKSFDNTVRIWSSKTERYEITLPHHYGLSVFNCDMRNLQPDSHLSDNDRAILRQYGAIID